MGPQTHGEPLPPLYARWVGELLGGDIPRESRATCDSCAMAGAGEKKEAGERVYFFDPVIKCCTYVPELYNFLAGRILSDRDPAAQPGRKSVEKRIAEGIGVSPLGLAQPPVFSLLYQNSSQVFGRTRHLRCPHYLEDGGRCGVWGSRNAICTTWFCKHLRGQVGYAFWRDSLQPLLQNLEKALSRWCLLELQISDDTLRRLCATPDWIGEAPAVTGDLLDNKVDQKAYAGIWGEWLGREHEFFIRCAELVNALSWTDALAIGGPNARAYARLTQDAYKRLTSEAIPPTLKVGSFQLIQIENALTRVSTYSEYDPIDVPQAVMELLRYFDGRPTQDALATIADEHGVRLDPALVRKMVDFKMLVAPEN